MLSAQFQQRAKKLSLVRRNFADEAKRAGFDFGQWGSDLSTCLAMLIPALTQAKADRLETFEVLRDRIIEGHTQGASERQKQNIPGAPSLETKTASSFKLRSLRWLWPERFALGKLGLIGGLPDKGKGLISCSLIASVTAGEPLPCNEGHAPQGNVICFAAEDDYEDTVVPRLIAAGANLDRVHIVRTMHSEGRERTFNMVTDLPALRAKIEEIGDVPLVMIDPMSAYLGVGKVNNSMTSDVRGFLTPLTDLAAEKGVAIIGIMHFNKKVDVTNAMLRISDSLAYAAAARHVYAVVDHPEVDKCRLFVKAKNNLGAPDTKTLSYLTGVRNVGTDDETGKEIWAPHVIWGADYVDISANEAMQAEAGGNKGRTERREAKQFLLDRLADGPVKQEDIISEGEALDISKGTLRRAKKELGIVSKKGKGIDIGWTWELPNG